MAKSNRDYNDFKNFVDKHSHLTRTQIYKDYKKNGGHIGKKKALDIIRGMWDIEKGEYIRKALPVVKNEQVKAKKRKRNSYIKLNIKKDTDHISLKSPAVRALKKNIEQLYRTNETKFLQVFIHVAGDEYSQERRFSILVPFNGSQNQGVKKLGQSIIDNLKIYYGNLNKKYKNQFNDLTAEIGENISTLQKEFNKSHYLDKQSLISLFALHGFEIQKIGILEFVDNEFQI
jgi:hypothetical protein